MFWYVACVERYTCGRLLYYDYQLCFGMLLVWRGIKADACLLRLSAVFWHVVFTVESMSWHVVFVESMSVDCFITIISCVLACCLCWEYECGLLYHNSSAVFWRVVCLERYACGCSAWFLPEVGVILFLLLLHIHNHKNKNKEKYVNKKKKKQMQQQKWPTQYECTCSFIVDRACR